MTRRNAIVAALLLLCMIHPAWAAVTFNGIAAPLSTGSITLSNPSDVAVDPTGNIFIADTSNNQIVEVSPSGTSSVLSITGLSPALSAPIGVAIDGSGDLLIADSGNSRIVEVTPAGAGSAVSTSSVTLSSPKGVVVDRSGNIYIADTGNNQIVQVTSAGAASVFFSSATLISSVALSGPSGLTVDTSGNLYVADSGNNRLVEITAAASGSVVSTASLGTPLSNPTGVALDYLGNIFIADQGNNRVVIIPVGQSATPYTTGSLTVTSPTGVSVDASGTVYIADTTGNRIVSDMNSVVGFGHLALGVTSGTVLTLPFSVDNATTLGSIKVATSGGAALDFTVGSGSTCAAGTTNTTCTVTVQFLPTAPGQRFGAVVLYDNSSPQLPVITVPLYGVADAPVAALAPNTATVINLGSGTLAFPFQPAMDGAGNIYVTNYLGNSVRKVAAGGGSSSLVSTGSITLSSPTGVAVDGAGNLFIADHLNSRIVVVTADGIPSILTVNGLSPGVNLPTELQIDRNGTLYITDYGSGRVLRVTGLSLATTTGGSSSGNGSVVSAGSFTFGSVSITGMAVDSKGTVYIADRSNNRVVEVTAGGTASLVSTTGAGALSNDQGVAVDAMDNLYIADSGHNRIVEVTTAGVASVVTLSGQTLGSSIFGLTADPSGNLIIADWNSNRLVNVNISGAVLAFPNTNVGATSASLTATLTNIGNLPLALPVPGSGNNPLIPANFTLDSTNTCPSLSSSSSAATLAVGAQCKLVVDFTPLSAGSLSGSMTFTDNNKNVANATQAVSLSGTGIQTQTTPTITWAAPASIIYGTALSSAQLNASSSVAGTFAYSPAAGAVLAVGTDTLSTTFTPTNTTTYTTATATQSIVVTQATSSIALSSSSGSGGITLTATVSSSGGTPTGSVQFFAGSTALGSGTLDSNGVATLTVASFPAGGGAISATYSGGADYTASTGTLASGFTMAASSGTIHVMPINTASVTLTVTPTNGFTGTVTFSCSGLPAGETCNFSPASVQANGNDAVQTSTLTVTPPTAASSMVGPGPGIPGSAAVLLFPGVIVGGVSGFQRRRGRGRRQGKGWLVLGLLSAFAALAGCDTGHLQTSTYNVTVTATTSGTVTGYQGPTTQTVALKVTLSR